MTSFHNNIYVTHTFDLLFSSIAHTIHESVTEQASILVNGNLKEYQIKVIIYLIENNTLNKYFIFIYRGLNGWCHYLTII